MSVGPRGFRQLGAQPILVQPEQNKPVEGRPVYHGPATPPAGVESRAAMIPSTMVGDRVPQAPAAVTSEHGEIERVDGFPVGSQGSWDGARRLTFRLSPGPWDQGLLVETGQPHTHTHVSGIPNPLRNPNGI